MDSGRKETIMTDGHPALKLIARINESRSCYLAMLSLAHSPRTEQGNISTDAILILSILAYSQVEKPEDETMSNFWVMLTDKEREVFAGLPAVRELGPDMQRWLNMAWIVDNAEGLADALRDSIPEFLEIMGKRG